MRRPLLVLLALLPAASALSPAPASSTASFPTGEAVFRPECFGLTDEFANLGPVNAARGTVLTKDFLNKVPAGRDYQSALGATSGAGAPQTSAAPPPPPAMAPVADASQVVPTP